MKIQFLSQNDPLYILPFFEEFLKHYADAFHINHVYLCRIMGKRSRIQLLRELTWLYGFSGVFKLTAESAISKTLGWIPRDRQAHLFSMPQLCRAYGIPVEQIGNPNDESFLKALAANPPDALVSVACPYILKQHLLSLPPRGCVNIHHAPLPRYKGMMPTFWQMYHGETQVGVTIHYMGSKIDVGSIVLQDFMSIEPDETLDHLIRRSKRWGAHAMAKALRQISYDGARAQPVDEAAGTYFTFPTREEAREFRRRGHRAI